MPVYLKKPSIFGALAGRFGRQAVTNQQQPQAAPMAPPAGNGQAGSYLQFSGVQQAQPINQGFGDPSLRWGHPPAAAQQSASPSVDQQASGRVSGRSVGYTNAGTTIGYGAAPERSQAGELGGITANNLDDIRMEGTPTAEAESSADWALDALRDKINNPDEWGAVQQDINAQRDAQLRSAYEQAASRGMAESGAMSGMAGDIYRASARDLAKAHMAYQQQQIDNMKDLAGMLLGNKWNQLDQNFQREMAEWMLENQAGLYEWIQTEGWKRESFEDFVNRKKREKEESGGRGYDLAQMTGGGSGVKKQAPADLGRYFNPAGLEP